MKECVLVWTGANGGEMTELPVTCLMPRRLLH